MPSVSPTQATRGPAASMALVGLLFVLMGASVAAAAWASARRKDCGEWVRHAHAVLLQAERTRTRLYEAQAEEETRELRLKRDHAARIDRALRAVAAEMDRLEGLAGRNVAHHERLKTLRLHWSRYEGKLRHPSGRDPHEAASADSALAFHRALRSLDAMRAQEERTLEERQDEWARSIGISDLTITLSAVTMALATVGLFVLIRREAVAKRREQAAVQERIEQLRDLSLRIPVAAIHLSEDGRIRMNEAAQRLTGFTNDEIANTDDWFRLTRGEGAEAARQAYESEREHAFNGTKLRTIQRKDGAERRLEFAGYSDGTEEVWIFHDVTERLESQAKLEEANRVLGDLAATDALTGLRNRRNFDEQAARAFDESAQEGHPLSVLMLDVDHFKSVNDRFGHDVGDSALRKVAHTIEWSLRSSDTAARYGGEEFAILLPDMDEGAAYAVGERIRRAIEAADFDHGTTTVSVGVATLSSGTDSPASLVRLADQALYVAKGSGRNRVCLGSEPNREHA